jgi:hypothetical protein
VEFITTSVWNRRGFGRQSFCTISGGGHELMARLKKGEHVPLFSKPKTFIFDSQPNLREI